jgi:hypothetical protein
MGGGSVMNGRGNNGGGSLYGKNDKSFNSSTNLKKKLNSPNSSNYQ